MKYRIHSQTKVQLAIHESHTKSSPPVHFPLTRFTYGITGLIAEGGRDLDFIYDSFTFASCLTVWILDFL